MEEGRLREAIDDAAHWVRTHLIYPWWDPIRFRLIDRYHVVQTGLEPGYHEVEDRMLYAAFSLLVEYVESQCANMNMWSFQDITGRIPFYDDRTAGLAYLAWEKSLVYGEDNSPPMSTDEDRGKPTPQALSAIETEALYLWWKDIRPKRLDPHIAAGWVDADWNPLYTEETSGELCMMVYEIEEHQYAEDEEMLIRLVKLRRSLWT